MQQELSFDNHPVIDIRVSARRRKTVGAHWEGDTIVITVPPRLSHEDRWTYADHLAGKLLAQRAKERPSDAALLARARQLSEQYLDGEAQPTSVTWSSRQLTRWGSCTPADGTIRISDRLKGVPDWVLDAVLIHELAHLLRLDHDALFHAYCARFPHMDASEHFLHGYALGLDRARSS